MTESKAAGTILLKAAVRKQAYECFSARQAAYADVTFDCQVDGSIGHQSWHGRHGSDTHVLSGLIVGDLLNGQRAILREHLGALDEHTQKQK